MNKKKLVIGAVAAALLSVGGLSAMAVAESPTTEHGSSTQQADNTKTDTDNIQLQQGDQTGPDKPGQAKEQEAKGPDTDNIQLQQGDQNAPDNAGQAEEQETNGPDTDNVQQGNQTEDGD